MDTQESNIHSDVTTGKERYEKLVDQMWTQAQRMVSTFDSKITQTLQLEGSFLDQARRYLSALKKGSGGVEKRNSESDYAKRQELINNIFEPKLIAAMGVFPDKPISITRNGGQVALSVRGRLGNKEVRIEFSVGNLGEPISEEAENQLGIKIYQGKGNVVSRFNMIPNKGSSEGKIMIKKQKRDGQGNLLGEFEEIELFDRGHFDSSGKLIDVPLRLTTRTPDDTKIGANYTLSNTGAVLIDWIIVTDAKGKGSRIYLEQDRLRKNMLSGVSVGGGMNARLRADKKEIELRKAWKTLGKKGTTEIHLPIEANLSDYLSLGDVQVEEIGEKNLLQA